MVAGKTLLGNREAIEQLKDVPVGPSYWSSKQEIWNTLLALNDCSTTPDGNPKGAEMGSGS